MSYKEIVLDCRELEAPEPLNTIVGNLDKINTRTYIKMVHRMEPGMLFNILKQNGYGYKLKYEGNDVLIYIWHTDFSELEAHIKGL